MGQFLTDFFHACLWQEHGWKEVVYETGFQAKVSSCGASTSLCFKGWYYSERQLLFTPVQADSRLRALSATFRVRNPDK